MRRPCTAALVLLAGCVDPGGDDASPDTDPADDTDVVDPCAPGVVALLDVGEQVVHGRGELVGFAAGRIVPEAAFTSGRGAERRLDVVAWASATDPSAPSSLAVLAGSLAWRFDVPVVADLDGDHVPELWAIEDLDRSRTFHAVWGTSTGLRSAPDVSLVVPSTRATSDTPPLLAVGELDGAPGLDVVAADVGSAVAVHAGPIRAGLSMLLPSRGLRLPSDGGGTTVGWLGVADVDGDGRDDVVLQVGLRGDVEVFRGPFTGVGTDGYAWATLDLGLGRLLDVGDVDGDGSLDLLFGDDRAGGTDAGAATVVFGPLDRVALDAGTRFTVHGDQPGGRVGIDGRLEDLDGDGRDEVIVAASGWDADGAVTREVDTGLPCEDEHDSGRSDCDDSALPWVSWQPRGAVAVFSPRGGGDPVFGEAPWVIHPEQAERDFPRKLLAADVDGDGRKELVITHRIDFHDGAEVPRVNANAATVVRLCPR